MEEILKRILSIKLHPISQLERKFRVIYLKGLGAFLAIYSEDKVLGYLYFKIWAQSILKEDIEMSEYWVKELSLIKKAISIQRKGFHFFTMKYSFFFDCFYLLISITKPNNEKKILNNEIQNFKKEVCGLLSSSAMKYVARYFVESNRNEFIYKKIDIALLQHEKMNRSYSRSQSKKILVVANVSAGKSTLINALIGYPISKTRTTACTSKTVKLYNKYCEDGITVQNIDNSYSYCYTIDGIDSEKLNGLGIRFQSELEPCICFVDTPGINNAENHSHITITQNAIKNHDYDILIYVSNCQYFGTDDEEKILKMLRQSVKIPIIFVLNQLDRFKKKEDSISKMIDEYKTWLKQLGFFKPIVIPTSAYAALLFKMEDILLDEDDIFDKEQLKKKFLSDYYDLPSYIGKQSDTLLSKTGVEYLEKTINNLIKQQI